MKNKLKKQNKLKLNISDYHSLFKSILAYLLMYRQQTPPLKILEICPFSAGICGVWTRVFAEAKELKKLGYSVYIFSSDKIRGTKERAEKEECFGNIQITRFSAKPSFFSKNVNYFNFKKKFYELKPDIVIAHLLHPHSFLALKLCLKNKIPCYLVTHAPFNVSRKFPLNLITRLYSLIKIKRQIKKFTKIIAITKWEIPYLLKMGIKKENLVYIPNSLVEAFFNQKKTKAKKDVLFLGRIAPVKSLETLLYAAEKLPFISFSLVGPSERTYLKKLDRIIKRLNLKNIKFFPPVYNIREKIKLIDNHKLFVLPSRREAMPQVLLEAMSRGKIVISSKTDGGKEIIQEKKSGFLFEIGDSEKLSELIKKNIRGNARIEKNSGQEAKKYSWNKLIKLYPFIPK